MTVTLEQTVTRMRALLEWAAEEGEDKLMIWDAEIKAFLEAVDERDRLRGAESREALFWTQAVRMKAALEEVEPLLSNVAVLARVHFALSEARAALAASAPASANGWQTISVPQPSYQEGCLPPDGDLIIVWDDGDFSIGAFNAEMMRIDFSHDEMCSICEYDGALFLVLPPLPPAPRDESREEAEVTG